MTAQLPHHLAQQLIDDQLRVARDRRRASLASTKDNGKDKKHQRALVQASLLLSRRLDRSTHRRSV
jgi:hypothetical protein